MSRNSAASFIMSLLFSTAGVFLFLHIAVKFNILDVPNIRSSHDKPTPRGGGLGLLFGFMVAALLNLALHESLPNWPFWIGLLVVSCVGLWDDLRGGLHSYKRLLAQLISALLVVFFYGHFTVLPLPAPVDIMINGLGYLLSIIWIIAVINFFNFMDGIDGIAGTQALITGMVIAFSTSSGLAWIGAATAGASLGFLFFNWQPAKIFLGDVGSYSLGFILAAAPFLHGSGEASRLTMLVGLSLWMFLTDASLTFMRRLFSREKVWEAHKSHLYQRLVGTGLSHSQVVLLIGFSSIIISVFAAFAYIVEKIWLWWAAFTIAGILFLFEILITNIRESSRLQFIR